MSFSLIDVNALQVLHLNLYKTFDLISLDVFETKIIFDSFG